MTDDHLVPVTTHLPLSMLAVIERTARKHETTASKLVAELVRRGLRHAAGSPHVVVRTIREERPNLQRGTRAEQAANRETIKEKIRELHLEGLSDTAIAERLILAQPTVSRYRRSMDLPALHVFPGGS